MRSRYLSVRSSANNRQGFCATISVGFTDAAHNNTNQTLMIYKLWLNTFVLTLYRDYIMTRQHVVGMDEGGL